MAGDDKCVYLYRSLATMLGNIESEFAAFRQKNVSCIGLQKWNSFCEYVR